MNAAVLSFDELVQRYCERQLCEPNQLQSRLQTIRDKYRPDGFMLLECKVLDSSRLGELTILPYGGDATFKAVPDHPISPRGLASDMSCVVATMPVAALEASCHTV